MITKKLIIRTLKVLFLVFTIYVLLSSFISDYLRTNSFNKYLSDLNPSDISKIEFSEDISVKGFGGELDTPYYIINNFEKISEIIGILKSCDVYKPQHPDFEYDTYMSLIDSSGNEKLRINLNYLKDVNKVFIYYWGRTTIRYESELLYDVIEHYEIKQKMNKP